MSEKYYTNMCRESYGVLIRHTHLLLQEMTLDGCTYVSTFYSQTGYFMCPRTWKSRGLKSGDGGGQFFGHPWPVQRQGKC
jgi:hypothetical protein